VIFHAYKTYASVLHCRNNRILLALAASQGWSLFQSDIEQAFLFGELDDVNLYIAQVPGVPCPPGHVCCLQKAVYGLHQAPLKFKQVLVSFFRDQGYVAANSSETIFIQRSSRGLMIHAIYVDDCLHFGDNPELFREFRRLFERRFKIKIGDADLYLQPGNQIRVD